MKLKEFIDQLNSLDNEFLNKDIYCASNDGKILEIEAFATKDDGFYFVLRQTDNEPKCKGGCKCKQKNSSQSVEQ